MEIFKKLLLWAIIFSITSIVVFVGVLFALPGFPFFPRTIFHSTSQDTMTRVGKGSYYIMFYVEGEKRLSVRRGNVGHVTITIRNLDGTKKSIPVSSADFYFDDAPNRVGIRGHAVGIVSRTL